MPPAAAPALALLMALSVLELGCTNGRAGHGDAAAKDAPATDFSGWDPAPTPQLRATTTLVDFGTVDVGTSSSVQDVFVAVTAGPLTPIPTVSGPGFALTESTCARPLEYGACRLGVTFTPTMIGAASGVLTIDAAGNRRGPAVIALSGIGVSGPGPFASFGAEAVQLGTLRVNQEAPAVVRLAPTRPVPTLACMSGSPDLTLTSQTCPTVGTIDTPCTFTFTFKAATVGIKNDAVICAGGGITLQKMVVATVIAAEPPIISPTAASFETGEGESDVVAFTVSNAASVTVGPLTAAISSGTGSFSVVSNGCSVPIAPAASCTIEVAFSPFSAGNMQGVLAVTDPSQPATAASASLSGTALAVDPWSIDPSIADFGAVAVDTVARRSFTLRYSGRRPSEAVTIWVSGPDFVVEGASCPSLAPGSTCTFAVAFKPTMLGDETAQILAKSGTVTIATARAIGRGVYIGAAVFDCNGSKDGGVSSEGVSFAPTAVGKTSPEVVCTTSNHGALDAGVLTITAAAAGDFTVIGQGCTQSECSIRLVFSPTVQGVRYGRVGGRLSHGSDMSIVSIDLTGIGL